MSESDVVKSDDDDTESVGSGSNTGSLDDSKNESKSVYFSDDDDVDEEGVRDIDETGSNDASMEKGGNDDEDAGGDDDDDDEYEDDDDDDILQKFDHETKKNTLQPTILNVYRLTTKKLKHCLALFEMKMVESLTPIIKRYRF